MLKIFILYNDKYLKLYKIKSKVYLESHINFTHEKDDLFFGLNYCFTISEITLDKNLFQFRLTNKYFPTHLYDL